MLIANFFILILHLYLLFTEFIKSRLLKKDWALSSNLFDKIMECTEQGR